MVAMRVGMLSEVLQNPACTALASRIACYCCPWSSCDLGNGTGPQAAGPTWAISAYLIGTWI